MSKVCYCLNIDEETIVSKIKQGFDTVDKIKDETLAGTGCGGCIKNIQKLIDEHKNQ